MCVFVQKHLHSVGLVPEREREKTKINREKEIETRKSIKT